MHSFRGIQNVSAYTQLSAICMATEGGTISVHRFGGKIFAIVECEQFSEFHHPLSYIMTNPLVHSISFSATVLTS